MGSKVRIFLIMYIIFLSWVYFVQTHYLDEKQTAAIDFIELPESVNINPELK